MKKLALLSAACGAILSQAAIAQNATTVPVGVVSVQLDANKRTVLSIPLEKTPVAFGIATTISSGSLTDSSANFASYSGTHFVRVLTGNAAGRVFRIVSNTSTNLSVATGTGSWALPADSSSGNSVNVAVNDRFEIIPMWTLGEIFGSSSSDCVLRTGANPNSADQIVVYADGLQNSYFNSGVNWRNAGNPGDTTNYNSLGIMPTSGLGVTRRSTGLNAVLQFTGSVPDIAPRYHLPGGARVAQSVPVAVNATLGNLGFSSMPSWNRNNNPNNADQVTVYRPDNTFNAYFLNASGVWRNAGNPGDTTDYANVSMPSGSGLFITRRGTSVGSVANTASTLPYNLNN